MVVLKLVKLEVRLGRYSGIQTTLPVAPAPGQEAPSTPKDRARSPSTRLFVTVRYSLQTTTPTDPWPLKAPTHLHTYALHPDVRPSLRERNDRLGGSRLDHVGGLTWPTMRGAKLSSLSGPLGIGR
ncbi:hypothetical protein CIB48_g11719 [Xylaria polymorpha]|nr:hypothetical protein CIB48_g11719 [Xylaria polymorpha]